jgi:hypothetical protein
MNSELRARVLARAEHEQTSVSELARDALRVYLDQPAVTPALRTRSGRVLSDADFEALAGEAETGYGGVTPQPLRRGPSQVVPIRMTPELKARAQARAELMLTSLSEVVRAALARH